MESSYLSDNDKLLIAELKRDEGIVDHAYQDSKGYWTIGVGRLIDKRKGGHLTTDEIEYLLMNDIDRKVSELDARIPWWRNLTPVRQRVMVNMTFNMGIGWIDKFPNTIKLIKDGKYAEAAMALSTSLWDKQVGDRADRLEEMMRKG